MTSLFEDGGALEFREIQQLHGHTDRVWGLAWNPATSGLLASCGGDKTVRIWEQSLSGSFECKAVLDETHTRTVRSCAWSPSGKMLATASFDNTTAVWQDVGGEYECVSSLEGHENEVKSVSWNASGSLLATSGRDKTVWIYPYERGFRSANETLNSSLLHQIFNRHLIGCRSRRPKLSDSLTPVIRLFLFFTHHDGTRPPPEPTASPSSFDSFSYSLSSPIRIIHSYSSAGMASLFEDGGALEFREIQQLHGHTDRVWGLAWNPATSGLLASCGGDKTVRIWEQSLSGSFECKAVLDETHTRTVRSCAWSPSGKMLATASFDNTTAVWQDVGGEYECVSSLEGHENEVKSVSWNSSGSLLATSGRDKTVWIWEVEPGNEFSCVSVLQSHTQDVKMAVWHPHLDLLFSCSYDNSVKIWAEDVDGDWLCVQTLNASNSGHTSTVWALSFNSTGDKMVTCSDDLTIKIWGTDGDIQSSSDDDYVPWKHLCTLSGYHDRTIFSVDWSRDGIISTGAADDGIRLFVENKSGGVDDPMYNLVLKKENAHEMDVNCVQWSPTQTGLLASASDDGTIKIWRLGSEA